MYNNSRTDKPGQNKDFQLKLMIFAIIIVLCFIALFSRIIYLQIIKVGMSNERVKKNRELVVRVPPIRGNIYSADNKLLAHNKESYDLYINPDSLYKNQELRQKEIIYLSQIINYEYSELEKLIRKDRGDSKEILIKKNISFQDYIKIIENEDKLPGVEAKKMMIRNYPFGKRLSHTLGYINPIDSDELSFKKSEGYKHDDLIGKSGVEKSFESTLRGEEGFNFYEVDARMRIIRTIEEKTVKPLPGDEIILSIDMEFQANIEDILADRTGAIVAMKPATGEIIGMASFPNYDPNIYILPSDENYELIKQLELDTRGTPLINRAIQAEYPPGSVYKMLPGLVILQENVVAPFKKYYCGGSYFINRERFGCWNHHPAQNLEEAIENSCDVYFYNTSQLIGIDRLYKYSKDFGLGESTGLDLPFEKSGFIPNKQWKKERGEYWHLGYTLITAIGQGDIKTTPIQLANYISVIANKGYSYRPHVVNEIRSSVTGETKYEVEPERVINLDINGEVFNFIHRSMRKVVETGTARGAFYGNPFKIAGKTGTAEIGFRVAGVKKQTHSLFAGFGPVDVPIEEQIVVAVIIEYENGHPLKYAGSIASMVFNSWLNKENYHESAKRIGYPIKDSYND